MTTLELKAQIIQDIGKEQDSVILEKLRVYYRKLKKAEKSLPCQYSLEELNQRLDEAEIEAANGGGTEHDKFMLEVETWL